jgi:putative sigma-54 modulation protein
MNIELSGHHVEITDSIRNSIESKFKKISSHYPDIDDLDVIVSVERKAQKVDVKTQFLGTTVNVKAEDHDLYAAIADAVKKLDSALGSRKGGAKAHLHEKPELN